MNILSTKRRNYGEHLTPIRVFREFILPEIKDELYNYVWVDLFAGEGNLILPILEMIPEDKRIAFFEKQIFLLDIQKEPIKKAIKNAVNYGIPQEIAEKNITQRDTIKNYPIFLLNLGLPVYHITNPPYLYIGYIVKHKETQKYLEYFKGENEGYQDLYQLALINDLRNNIKKMIYIIPSNFLFGFSVSNKVRDDFLKYYMIKKAIIFERRIFEYTGTNVIICFFERKSSPKDEIISFEAAKIGKSTEKRIYILNPKNHYRAGNEFEEFVDKYRAIKPLGIKYYLTIEEVLQNRGEFKIKVIDANAFNGKEYERREISVNKELYQKIKTNPLFVRTLDTGSKRGRAGIYFIDEEFGVDGILVTKAPYRTHPVQIFFEQKLSKEELTLVKEIFNLILEYFREKTDSEFMTTYKYSNSEYTRKYFGLKQAKKLLQTIPIPMLMSEEKKKEIIGLIKERDVEGIIKIIKREKSTETLEEFFQ